MLYQLMPCIVYADLRRISIQPTSDYDQYPGIHDRLKGQPLEAACRGPLELLISKNTYPAIGMALHKFNHSQRKRT